MIVLIVLLVLAVAAVAVLTVLLVRRSRALSVADRRSVEQQREADEARSEAAGLRALVGEAETARDDAERRVGEAEQRAEREAEALRSQMAEAESGRDEQARQLDEAQQQVEGLQARLDEAEAARDEAGRRLQEREGEIAALHSGSGELESARAEAARLLEEAERQVARLEASPPASKSAGEGRRKGRRSPAKAGGDDEITLERAAPAGNAGVAGGADPGALWALELLRSERTWRHSVALDRSASSPFEEGRDPLQVAIEIEASAIREDVGAEVHVEWDLPRQLGTGAALAVLRAAQELLAVAARAAESSVLLLTVDGDDIIVLLSLGDERGEPVAVTVPPLPPGQMQAIDNGVRVVGGASSSVATASA